MKKTLILFCSLFSLLLAARFQLFGPHQTPPTRIAFGSGSRQTPELPPWPAIVRNRPKLWVRLGDDPSGDPADPARMQWKYALIKTHPDYQQLLATCSVVGIRDTYDYGVNEAQEYAHEVGGPPRALDPPGKSVNRPHPARQGTYAAYGYGKKNRQVKVILLDGRCLGDERKEGVGTADPAGEAQWAWLEKELTNSPAAVHLIGFGIRALPGESPYPERANPPRARQRLLDLIGKIRPRGVILLNSDRHAAEMSCVALPGYAYPVYEVTTSGPTVGQETGAGHKRPAVGGWAGPLNFGLLTIDWEARPLAVELQVRDLHNAVLLGQRVVFEEAPQSTTEE
ncbi:MAG: alkaline phosphatase family protein [Ferruginibacter sp.]|nr:alkaline phosphatase family protein [Cytophagales bacterium]